MKKVWAILVNWNKPVDTIDAVNSLLLAQGTFELEVLIVDNASTDNSLIRFEDEFKTNKKISILKNKENLGFTGGNNLGIKEAIKNKADFLLIINNDTYIDKNLVVELLATFETYPEAGIASPKIYFAPGFEYHKKYSKAEIGKVIWYAGGGNGLG